MILNPTPDDIIIVVNKTKKVFLILFILIILSTAYLYFTGFFANSVNPKQNVLTISLDQNGSTIDVKNGDTIKLSLKGNITTGFSWEIASIDQDYLVQEGDMEYSDMPNPKNLTGTPGIFNYSFKAVKQGETSLKIIYHQPWEKDVEPYDTFTLNIKISN